MTFKNLPLTNQKSTDAMATSGVLRHSAQSVMYNVNICSFTKRQCSSEEFASAATLTHYGGVYVSQFACNDMVAAIYHSKTEVTRSAGRGVPFTTNERLPHALLINTSGIDFYRFFVIPF